MLVYLKAQKLERSEWCLEEMKTVFLYVVPNQLP